MAMEMRKKVALAYVRVSTEEQADGGSPETQRAAIEAYANKNGYVIAKNDWFEDLGFSAKTAKRPKLQKMLKVVEQRKSKIDAVIIYNSTRISRDMLTFFCEIVAPLRRNGVALKSATENYGDADDPTGDVAMVLGVMVGEIDNKTKSKFTKDNMSMHVQNGGWWMGPAPLGFIIERVNTGSRDEQGKMRSHATLKPDMRNDLARKMSDMITWFSTNTVSRAELARKAEEIGIRSQKGNILDADDWKTILRKPVYAGWHKSPKTTKNELIKMNFDGLISWETFEKNQRILSGDSRPYEESDNALYPLHKTICCAICGAEMTDEEREVRLIKGKLPYLRSSAPKNGSGKHIPRYGCKCKGHGSMLATDAHAIFEEYLKQITPEEGTVKLFKEIVKRTALKKLGNINKEIEEYERKRAELSEKKQKAIAAMLDGDISKEEKEEYVSGLNAERSKIEDKLTELKQAQLLREADIEYVCDFMRNPAKLWRDGDLETKQAIQKMVFPHGIFFDLKNKKCGTDKISPLFSVIDIKKASNDANLNHMGWDNGIEPSTFWTTIRRSNHLS